MCERTSLIMSIAGLLLQLLPASIIPMPLCRVIAFLLPSQCPPVTFVLASQLVLHLCFHCLPLPVRAFCQSVGGASAIEDHASEVVYNDVCVHTDGEIG